jgi:hypothetical protein
MTLPVVQRQAPGRGTEDESPVQMIVAEVLSPLVGRYSTTFVASWAVPRNLK